ncbi:MAG: hypothetical protein KDA24_29535 [Deltaproteobacteria bacterium]|nr:hypothetical protein [Deltaproteobacteria bacterium]
MDDSLAAELRALLAEGKQLHAIQLHHERTGCDLHTSRDAVVALEESMPQPPSSDPPQVSEGGLPLRLLIFVVMAAAVAWAWKVFTS